MANLGKVLKDLNKTWKNTEPIEIQERVNVPDGNYVAVMEPAGVELAKSSERLQIAWPMKISDGKFKGKRVIKFDGLDSELSISWVKGVMNVLGIEIPKVAEDLPEVLEKFFKKEYDDRPINISIKTTDDFTNIYINGYADGAESEGKKEKEEEKEEKSSKNKVEKPSKKEIKEMSRKELKAVIEEHGLEKDVDPDDYSDNKELRDAVIEALDL